MTGLRPGESISGWVLDHMIGQGSFATVWRANKKDPSGTKLAAVKAIATERLSPKLRESLGSEVSILKRISHENVVKLYEVLELGNWLFLVMEYCGGGDLAGYLRNKRISEAQARHFMQQLSFGMKELWLNNFVHRDLKPHNLLLVDNSDMPVIKIADFGFARNLQPQGLAATVCGSPMYMAPEILQANKYDAKADLWSVGVILYELVVGQPPFNGANYMLLVDSIRRREARIPHHTINSVSPECIDLIQGLLKRSAVERMSFTEFFAHPFIGSGELSKPGAKYKSPGEVRVQIPSISNSGMSAHTHSSGSSEHLPFSMDANDGLSSEARSAHRVQSAPLNSNAQPILTVSQKQAMKERALASSNLLEDEDYVIIERTNSASGSSGLRAYSQSAPSKSQLNSKSFKLPPPPPSMLVPLVSASIVPPSSMARSLAGVKFNSGVPRGENLKRVAFLLEDIGAQRQNSGLYAESLALRLLALQVLHAASECGRPQLAGLPESTLLQEGEIASTNPKPHPLAAHMASIANKAEQVGNLFSSEGKGEMLPDVWDLVYKAALSHAKAAAVDELISSHCSALRSYAKAGSLLYFIFAEGSELPLQPKLVLAPQDIIRLQRYTACVALRHQGCVANISNSGKPATLRLQGNIQNQLKLPDPLAMSVSAQPPLRSK